MAIVRGKASVIVRDHGDTEALSKQSNMLIDVHQAQLPTYLRLTHKRVGLLLNFKVAVLKNGIVRRVL